MPDKRVETTKDVIEASKIVVYPGMYPVRIVLRKIEGENKFVTHKESMTSLPSTEETSCAFKHHSFADGHYFPWGDFHKKTQEQAFDEAMKDMGERVSRL